mmetsp:Transcript_98480/g.273972  ORF Transcript_98480/g.273972 Transcript_98480/m.273972 type:complete len:225 (+) Transcript_98480:1398-2072(+)
MEHDERLRLCGLAAVPLAPLAQLGCGHDIIRLEVRVHEQQLRLAAVFRAWRRLPPLGHELPRSLLQVAMPFVEPVDDVLRIRNLAVIQHVLEVPRLPLHAALHGLQVADHVVDEDPPHLHQRDLVPRLQQHRPLCREEPGSLLVKSGEALLFVEDPTAPFHAQETRVVLAQPLVQKDELIAERGVAATICIGLERALLETRDLGKEALVLHQGLGVLLDALHIA